MRRNGNLPKEALRNSSLAGPGAAPARRTSPGVGSEPGGGRPRSGSGPRISAWNFLGLGGDSESAAAAVCERELSCSAAGLTISRRSEPSARLSL